MYAADDAIIWNGATIIGPTIIGHKAEIRPGAFIRGCVIIGDEALIGNSTEVKNAIIFDKAQLPHYNYVGDSIIGYQAHMGAIYNCKFRVFTLSPKFAVIRPYSFQTLLFTSSEASCIR